MDEHSIEIKNLEAVARLGITDIERREMQKISICLRLIPDYSLSGLADDIKRTVNYQSVSQCVIDLAALGERNLIETLADDLAVMLLDQFNLRGVVVEIRKFILPETDYVAVKLVRKK
jgi:dihydroneopterin aldolase